MRPFASLRKAVVALLAIALAFVASGWFAIGTLRARLKPRYTETPPAALVGRVEELRLRTSDGEDLGAWYFAAGDAQAPTVILLHGKGGDRGSSLTPAGVFIERGCAALLVSLRVHGDSTGELDDFGWSARHDVVAAVAWARARRPQARIVLCGASLGAAAAVFAAAELPAAVDAYWLECLYTDLDTAALRRCQQQLPLGLGYLAHQALLLGAALRWPEWREIAPVARMASLRAPGGVWILAGAEDQLATVEDAQALAAACSKPARLVIIEGAKHDGLVHYNRAAYARTADEFLHALRELPR